MSTPSPEPGTPGYDEWAAQDKGSYILIVSWTFIALATVCVLGRLYVRGLIHRQLRSDDWWCLSGLICGILSSTFMSVAISHGNGRHFDLLGKEQQESVIYWTIAAFCPGVLTFSLPKLAVVALLARIMNPSRYHLWFLWFLAIWGLLTMCATIGTLLGQCTPAESQWNFDIEGTCVDKKSIVNFSIYAGVYSAFTDVYLAVYPSVVLFSLQMKFIKKVALTCALGIGCVGGAFAIYKTTRIPAGLASSDFSYDSPDLGVWTLIEGSTIIMACSIPVMSPLMDLIFGRVNPFRSSKRRLYDYPEQKNSKQRDFEMGRSTTRRTKSTTRVKSVWNDSIIYGDDASIENMPPSKPSIHIEVRRDESSSVQPPAEGQILRTDEVTLTYENGRDTYIKPIR